MATYYVHDQGQTYGPYEPLQLRQMYFTGQLSAEALVSIDQSLWLAIKEVIGVSEDPEGERVKKLKKSALIIEAATLFIACIPGIGVIVGLPLIGVVTITLLVIGIMMIANGAALSGLYALVRGLIMLPIIAIALQLFSLWLVGKAGKSMSDSINSTARQSNAEKGMTAQSYKALVDKIPEGNWQYGAIKIEKIYADNSMIRGSYADSGKPVLLLRAPGSRALVVGEVIRGKYGLYNEDEEGTPLVIEWAY